MVITHHGGQCFKITFGDLTLVFDPISKDSKLSAVRFGADIAIVSRNHPDMNGIDEVSSGKELFQIYGPGEYERQGIVIQGFLSNSIFGLSKNQEKAVNTIYSVKLEDMTLVFLGALSDSEIPHEARESVGDIDVLFVPIGGEGVLSPAKANEIAVSLEPKIIIPMHWSGIGAPKSLETFLKGSDGVETVNKLTLKKKDLSGKEGSIIVITE